MRNNILGNCGVHWYADAIARHESRNVSLYYNQFNEGTSSYSGEPNYGAPDGWGIFQIDRIAAEEAPWSGGVAVGYTSTGETWDWQENIASGIYKLGIKRNIQSSFRIPSARSTITGLPETVNVSGHTFYRDDDPNEPNRFKLWDLDTIKRNNSGKVFSWDGVRLRWTYYPDNVSGYCESVMQEYIAP